MASVIDDGTTYAASAYAETEQFGQGDEEDAGQGQEGEVEEEEDGDEEDGVRKLGNRGKTWCATEDVLLAQAWMNVSMCGEKGANQRKKAYWTRIQKDYTERRSYPPHEDLPNRNAKLVESRWGVISALTTKFHHCNEQILQRDESGKNDADKVSRSS